MWSPSLLLSSQVSERPKEHPVKSWNSMTNSFPGQWRQGSNLWSTSIQSDLQQRLSYEFDRPLHTERLIAAGVRASIISVQEKKVADSSERLASGSLNHIVRNGTAAPDSASAFNMYREEGNSLQDPGHHLGDNDPVSSRKGVISDPCSTSSSGVNFDPHPNSCAKSLPSTVLKGDSSCLLVGLAATFSSPNGSNNPGRASMTHSQRQMPPPLPRQLPPNPHNVNDASVEVRSGRSRVDARARAQLLPRYWPRITDQELQQISGEYPLNFCHHYHFFFIILKLLIYSSNLSLA